MFHKPTTEDLVLAIIDGDMDGVRRMCAAGVSVVDPDPYGWLPIHRAAANDRGDMIRLLLKRGSPLEPTGTEQWTPLHLASVSRSPHAVRALLEAGADIHARSESGQTPLHLAVGPTVTGPLLETVRLLVSAGADRQAADDEGTTPLDQAVAIPDPELRRLLGVDAA